MSETSALSRGPSAKPACSEASGLLAGVVKDGRTVCFGLAFSARGRRAGGGGGKSPGTRKVEWGWEGGVDTAVLPNMPRAQIEEI